MVAAWLAIESDPPRAFYREPAARALIDTDLAHARLTGIGPLRRPMAIPGVLAGESANVRVSLDNADGAGVDLWRADPPLRAVARILSDAGELFAGIITEVDLSSEASLTIEAGFVRPMSDKMPLRSTTEWGSYEDVRTIPVPYGRTTLEPIQYDATRRLWVCAEGAIAGITEVRIDGQISTAWAWRNGVDRAGKTVAYLELVNPLAEGASLAVDLRGRVHPQRGHMMALPDEILWDVLTNVCGLGIAPARLDAFRSEVVGLEIGGVLDDSTITIRAQIDRLMQSIGAAWSVSADGIAALWPFVDDGLTPTTVQAGPLTMQNIQPEASHTDLVNVLRVKYAYDWSTGQHTKTVEITDPDSIRQYGRLEADWDAAWLRLERQAQALGQRLLTSMAWPRWQVTWISPDTQARPGDWAEITHPGSPITGRARLVSAEPDDANLRTTLVIIGSGRVAALAPPAAN